MFAHSESILHAAAIGEYVAKVNFQESPTLSKDQSERLFRYIVGWEEMFANHRDKPKMPRQQSDGDQAANEKNEANEANRPAQVTEYEKASYILYSAAESYLIEKHQVLKPKQIAIYDILISCLGNEIDREKLGIPNSYELPDGFDAFARAYRRGRDGLADTD